MKAAVIVPFHEPRWLDNVVANIRRQTVQLPVVAAVNGPAKALALPWTAVQSAQSHAEAVNAGAAWALQRGFTHAVCIDSDDFYGPAYVATQLAGLAGADYVGKRAVHTWLADGLHLFERPGGKFMGGTLGFALDKLLPMRPVLQDDTEWCERMAAAGAIGADTGPEHYCYVRHGNNAHWRADDVMVRRAWGGSRHYPQAPIEAVSGNPGPCVAVPAPTDAEVFAAMAGGSFR